MIKLDEETRSIPLLTYTIEFDPSADDSEKSEAGDSGMSLAPKPALSMN
jgi:hypothetical protein